MKIGRIYRHAKKVANVPSPIKTNMDYGSGVNKILDEQRENDADDGDGTLQTKIYCDSPENNKYWKEMGSDEAAKDFQEYAKEVKCDKAKSPK